MRAIMDKINLHFVLIFCIPFLFNVQLSHAATEYSKALLDSNAAAVPGSSQQSIVGGIPLDAINNIFNTSELPPIDASWFVTINNGKVSSCHRCNILNGIFALASVTVPSFTSLEYPKVCWQSH